MKRGSFLTDLMDVSLPMAVAAIDKACRSKRKSKEKDEIMLSARDTLLWKYPLSKYPPKRSGK